MTPRLAGSLPEEMYLGQYIPIHYHYNMLQDRARTGGFRAAIEHVTPVGGRVLELGGGTGVLSWFAAQKAEKVWCVERNPALVRAARQFLDGNPRGEHVEVVQADARSYLPPEPVDVVICEMLHVAMVREKQLEVLAGFRENYLAEFGPPLPVFVPDVTLLAVQPVEQGFCFEGYRAEVPLFVAPGAPGLGQPLAEPCAYATIDYASDIPKRFDWRGEFVLDHDGMINALAFLTRNFLAFVYSENRAIDWMMNQLVLPLAEPLHGRAGEPISVSFGYEAGCSLETLQESLVVHSLAETVPLRRAA